jgi:hypothetical protein
VRTDTLMQEALSLVLAQIGVLVTQHELDCCDGVSVGREHARGSGVRVGGKGGGRGG